LESLEFSGDHQIEDGDIEEVIASKQSPRFLGIESGIIYDYEVSNASSVTTERAVIIGLV